MAVSNALLPLLTFQHNNIQYGFTPYLPSTLTLSNVALTYTYLPAWQYPMCFYPLLTLHFDIIQCSFNLCIHVPSSIAVSNVMNVALTPTYLPAWQYPIWFYPLPTFHLDIIQCGFNPYILSNNTVSNVAVTPNIPWSLTLSNEDLHPYILANMMTYIYSFKPNLPSSLMTAIIFWHTPFWQYFQRP